MPPISRHPPIEGSDPALEDGARHGARPVLLAVHLTGNRSVSRFLKQPGLRACPMPRGVSNSPTALTQTATVSLSLDFLSPAQSLPLTASVLSGRARKNNPVSSML